MEPRFGHDFSQVRVHADARGSQYLQRDAANAEPIDEVPQVVHQELRSSGQPLDPASRAFFEARFGDDFSSVRIHQDAKAGESARAVNAMAYTVNNDVVFEVGRYAPNTREGRRLLAHELTHVVQQRSAAPGIAGKLKVGAAGDARERAADRAAQTIDSGGQVEVASSGEGVLHRQLLPIGPDAIHQPRIKDFRRRAGLPESGRDVYGDPVGPTDAQIKYELNRPVEDPSRIRIDAIADVLASSLTAPRRVGVHVNDALVVSLHWDLMNPEGRIIASMPTTAGQANATQQPFTLEPRQFAGQGFVAGQYVLYCYGEDSSQYGVVYARRDFNVLSDELKESKGLDTTYGKLTFTKYDSLNADLKDPEPHYEVDVTLDFLPNKKAPCKDVAFIQAVQSVNADGESRLHLAHPDLAARQTKLAWSIDQRMGAGSPYYGTKLPPEKNPTSVPSHDPYGHSTKEGPEARLKDEPGGTALPGSKSFQGQTARFESCAVCRSGQNIGQVYGCATWGFTADDKWRVKLMPPSFRQMASETFLAAAAGWNIWRDTKPTAQRPDELPELKRP
jgi:Domain of unknown function (DUF4157)